MKKIIILAALVCTTSYAAPLKGITEAGDEVLLNDDGTWSYLSPSEVEIENIKTNPDIFTTPAKSTFLIKSSKNNIQVRINPKKWRFNKNKQGASEYDFEFKDYDVYAMMINESLEMDVESLAQVALDNARDAGPDIKLIQKEYRNVNGKNVIFMQMAGTVSGMKITYLGYYYSNHTGMTQLLAYTGTSSVEKYRSEIEEFLNGLTVGDE